MPTKKIASNVSALKKSIGENIEQVRLQKKISIKEMAALLNLTHTGYRNIERGKTEITVTKIFQIAIFLDISFIQLIDTENSFLSLNNDNAANKQVIEALKSTLHHYKEEISFLRRQLELLTSSDFPSFKQLKKIG